MTYSYFADPLFVFMDEEYNQYEIEEENMGDAVNYLKDGMECEAVFYDGKAISVELPTTIARQVVYSEPAVKGNKTFLPKADDSARLMAEALEGYDVEVRYFIRDFAGFLPSWYVQQVRMGNDMEFDRFTKAYNLDRATWVPAVESLRKYFGTERVQIFDHAALVKDAHGVFCRAFPEIMEALGEAGRNPPNKNTSIGRGMVNAYRRWNAISERIGWSQKSKKTIQHIGRRYFLLPFERFSRSEKIKFDPETARQMTARYKADIEAIKAAAPTPTL